MYIIKGQGVSDGQASGRLHIIENNICIVPEKHCKNIELELFKFQKARADAMNQLQSAYEKALHKVGESSAKIFAIQQMMINENGFSDAVRKMIANDSVVAEYAVYLTAHKYMIMLEDTNDEYLMARTADVHDVSQRIIKNMDRKKRNVFNAPKEDNIIIYKNYLTPSEIIELDTKHVLAALTFKDSKYSHSAILARTMKLPRITNVSEDICRYKGRHISIDANTGEVSIKLK